MIRYWSFITSFFIISHSPINSGGNDEIKFIGVKQIFSPAACCDVKTSEKKLNRIICKNCFRKKRLDTESSLRFAVPPTHWNETNKSTRIIRRTKIFFRTHPAHVIIYAFKICLENSRHCTITSMSGRPITILIMKKSILPIRIKTYDSKEESE